VVPDQDAGDQVRRAREALAAARAGARAKGLRPTTPARPQPASPTDAGRESRVGQDQAGLGPGLELIAGRESRAGDGVTDGPVPGVGAPTTMPAGSPADAPPAGVAPVVGSPATGSPATGAARRHQRWSARPGFPSQPQRSDPQPLGTAINGLLDAEGWALAAATGSVFGRWPQIVGADLAAHTRPETLADGELTVTADSTAWATQVRLLAAQLVRRLNAELGDGTVLRVKVRGPVTSTRKPGEWRVRGGRGPRDTYG
jgi:predicted nucleic acid-binding Zn ribbon protein